MWIRTIASVDAEGLLKRLYDAAIKRAGKVYGIVRSMSLNPQVMRSSLGLYRDVMMGPSPLSRVQREMLATAVSVFNGCEY
jgi:alkylhydroperoxidase family enzyme